MLYPRSRLQAMAHVRNKMTADEHRVLTDDVLITALLPSLALDLATLFALGADL